MTARYETDVVAWANEQAAFVRAGRFDQLDLDHIADEIEDVGKAEQRELARRLAALLTDLLKWKYQPDKSSSHGAQIIQKRRKLALLAIQQTPSLSLMLTSPYWLADIGLTALLNAVEETGLAVETFPEECPWSMTQEVLQMGWFPR